MSKRLASLLQRSSQGHCISVLTSYDYPTALALDRAGVDIIFVGDSVGTNVLGYQSVEEVTMEDMVHHTRAVRRGVEQALVMADLPFQSFTTPAQALANAKQLVEAGADIIKLEGGAEVAPQIHAIRESDIVVMSHIGYTPQNPTKQGSVVVGAKAEEAIQLYRDAQAVEEAGACMMVLECVPEKVAREITNRISAPTIGIGSGRHCSGQVLVITDLLGWYDKPFRFVVRYADFAGDAEAAGKRFCDAIQNQTYPGEENIFRLKQEEFNNFLEAITNYK
ncbi:MAG: 3-methyl-2-oxobutanoate hydroxymethyltransferase [Planctomycetota bacterium]|jgi:3-methyl-2-oxobutanoate hydroxymethyltransferase